MLIYWKEKLIYEKKEKKKIGINAETKIPRAFLISVFSPSSISCTLPSLLSPLPPSPWPVLPSRRIHH